MKNFKFLNNVFGWLSFAIASVVYILTIEPTASFWDCGEFISTSYKLLVGHPPGAPFFMILGRFFSLFAGEPSQVALLVNIMSALSSGLTIMFLFWTITHLGRKIFVSEEQNENWRPFAVLAAGFVGAMAYTFSDSFWFSAVEGEVYAMSSLFTAVVFWAILKWENVADEPHSNRWLILIAYLMGLSIGVHLLNLLAIPAIVMVYYYKKFEVNNKNTVKALLLSGVILGGILYGVIPGVVSIASSFELFFVNVLGASFNTGVLIYAIILIGGLVAGIYFTHVKQKAVLNMILLVVTVILIGYSSFAMIVIRSYANPTMDQNSPEDVFSLMGYLNREQYGDRPLLFGQYYNSEIDREATQEHEGKPVYIKKNGRYEIVEHRTEYFYDSRTTTFFPRMYSREQRHINEYKKWADISSGRKVVIEDSNTGQSKTITLPTFFQNLKFFFNYQVNHMYMRYFLWNFSGRQNDIQGHGELHKGNWITGFDFIDNWMYGDVSKLPELYKNNPARNKYYMLPLLLGLAGLFFQYNSGKKGQRGFWVVMLLFLLTGLAIVLYLNQTPLQPRERDYAYAGSFYAFAIWIGLGVLAVVDGLKRIMPGMASVVTALLATVIFVPGIMACENWDDHSRSERYVARDLAHNYLNTCAPNAIIFTNGDNDTFPLWYSQEVEGVRTDVRVCNLSYLQTDWYIDQMKRKAYKSDPMPFSLEHDQYVTGTRDVVYLIDRIDGDVDLKQAIKFVGSDKENTKQVPGYYEKIDYLPSKSFKLPVDSIKVVQKGLVDAEDAHLIAPEVNINLSKDYILKNELMILDLLATNNWDRPIYFAVTVGSENYVSLQDYFQLEGFAYQVVPIKTSNDDGQYGRVDTDRMYDNVVNKYVWSGFDNPNVYLDENHLRMAMNIRNNFSRLANALLDEGDKERAVTVLNLVEQKLPPSRVPHNYFSIFLAEACYRAGLDEKGDDILRTFGKDNLQELEYFSSVRAGKKGLVSRDVERSMTIYYEVAKMAQRHEREELLKEFDKDYQSSLEKLKFFYQ